MTRQIHGVDADEFPVDAPGRPLTHGRVRDFIVRRYSPRIHMSLILSACGFASMVTSWTLLHVGVHSMLVRYPVAMGMAYGTFLFGVWAWLLATGIGGVRESLARRASGFDAPSGGSSSGSSGGSTGDVSGGGESFSGKGGTFDGGGANASWGEPPSSAPANSSVVQASSGSGSSGSKPGGGIGLDIDGDGLVLLILAAILALVILCTSGYLIWSAPDVLTEAAFGAALTGTLHGATRANASGGWVSGVVRKTWWPFALVLVAALAFAGWSAMHFPQAHTFREAITAAVHSHAS